MAFLNDMEYPQHGSSSKVHIQLFGIFRWHGWSVYLYLTLRTPALGTEPRMYPTSHSSTPNSQLTTLSSEFPIPARSCLGNMRLYVLAKCGWDQMIATHGSKLKANDKWRIIKGLEPKVNHPRSKGKGSIASK